MSSPIQRVEQLIALACSTTSDEEARTAAITAVRLMKKHGMTVRKKPPEQPHVSVGEPPQRPAPSPGPMHYTWTPHVDDRTGHRPTAEQQARVVDDFFSASSRSPDFEARQRVVDDFFRNAGNVPDLSDLFREHFARMNRDRKSSVSDPPYARYAGKSPGVYADEDEELRRRVSEQARRATEPSREFDRPVGPLTLSPPSAHQEGPRRVSVG